jgi:hypothetical protein
MGADDLTRAQARALQNKLGPMRSYLNRLGKRMSGKGFPEDDSMRLLVVAALKAMHELQTEVTCRSMDRKGQDDVPRPPALIRYSQGKVHRVRPIDASGATD